MVIKEEDLEYLEYFLENKKALINILEVQKGEIDYKILYEIFYARNIASGQTYYKAKTIALLEFLNQGNRIVIKHQEKEAIIHSEKELAKYFKKEESGFTSFREELAPYSVPSGN